MTRYVPQWLQAGSYAGSQDRRLIGALWPAAASSGCAVSAGSAMTVNVAAGQVAVPTQNNTGTTLCSSDGVEQVTLTAAPASGTNRIDLVTCHPRGNDLDGGANTDFIFDFVTGTAAATPSIPATPAGQVALAQVYIPGGSAAVTAGNITDVRPGNLPIPYSGSSPTAGPRGLLASATGPPSAFNAASGTVWTWAPGVAVSPNRKYRLSLWVQGGQQGATSNVIYFTFGDSLGYFGGASARAIWFGTGLASGASLALSSSKMYLPATAGTPTFTFSVLTSTGTFSIGANFMEATLEDLGGT